MLLMVQAKQNIILKRLDRGLGFFLRFCFSTGDLISRMILLKNDHPIDFSHTFL